MVTFVNQKKLVYMELREFTLNLMFDSTHTNTCTPMSEDLNC